MDRIDVFKSDDVVYIKVVDYKTGAKQFSLEDIQKGLNTQLLLYLFAICHCESAALKSKLGVTEETTVKPAGALYMSTAFSPIKLDKQTSEEDVLRLAGTEMKRSGLLVNKGEVLDAVSRSHKKNLLAGISFKDDTRTGKALIEEKELEDLEGELQETIREIALEIKSGSALACDSTQKDAPCKYCKMRPVCRVQIHEVPEEE